MKILKISLLSFLFLSSLQVVFAKKIKLDDGIYSIISTSKGEITVALFVSEMPVSVANFISLAEGKRAGEIDPSIKGKPFYNNSKVQGVLSGYSVQTENTFYTNTTTKIGYSLPQEQNDSLSSLSNILCVASNNTENNGSRLVFTLETFPFINGLNTPIGKIIEGIEVVNSLKEGDRLETVRVVRIGKVAKKFNTEQTIKKALNLQHKEEKLYKESEEKRLLAGLHSVLENNDEAYHFFGKAKLEAYEKGIEISNGIRLMKWKTTEGPLAKHGEKIWVSFIGYLPNGRVFDSSYDNSEAMRFTFGSGETIKAWDKIFEHVRLGEKATVIIPSSMAYGKKGADRTIPPYTTLIFDVTLEEIEE